MISVNEIFQVPLRFFQDLKIIGGSALQYHSEGLRLMDHQLQVLLN